VSQYKNIKGGAELQKFLDQLPAKMEANVMRSALRAGAKVIADEAKANVPVKDGDLRDSIKVSTRLSRGVVTATVKAGSKKAWYWRFVEFGTASHYISVQESEKPINTRRGANFGKAVSMTTINRNVLRIGSRFIGPTVMHPGAKARPFMRPALDGKANDALEAVGEAIKKRLTKQGIDAKGIDIDITAESE
jgi:HK97 gp10 family phage protein